MIVGRVPSLSEQGVVYDIERAGDRLTCTCPAYAFGKRATKTCKHIRIYEAAQHLMQKCNDLGHGTDGVALCASCLLAVLAAAAAKVRRQKKRG